MAELKEDFTLKTSEVQELSAELEKTENTLNKASSLLNKLSDERERWKLQVALGALNLKLRCTYCGRYCGIW